MTAMTRAECAHLGILADRAVALATEQDANAPEVDDAFKELGRQFAAVFASLPKPVAP